jgi:hypothetical protein
LVVSAIVILKKVRVGITCNLTALGNITVALSLLIMIVFIPLLLLDKNPDII